MTARAKQVKPLITLVLLAALVAGAALSGCGDTPPEMQIDAAFEWNETPATTAEIGYMSTIRITWPDRSVSCFPLSPNLRVTTNDRDAIAMESSGACAPTLSFQSTAIDTGGPVTIRLLDGDRKLGEAVFEGAFPGAATRLGAPVDGKVQPGGDVSVYLPTSIQSPSDLDLEARFYWRDTPATVPPFFTPARAQNVMLGASGPGLATTAPAAAGLGGHAALMFGLFQPQDAVATSCSGFTFCRSVAWIGVGPVEVEVATP